MNRATSTLLKPSTVSTVGRRYFAASAGGGRVNSHTAVFGALMIPAAAYMAVYGVNGPDSNLETELESKYKNQIEKVKAKNEHTGEHLKRAILGMKPTMKADGAESTTTSRSAEQVDELLKAGKDGTRKRNVVDGRLYGSDEAALERKKQQQKPQQKLAKEEKAPEVEAKASSSGVKTALALVATGAAGAGVGYLVAAGASLAGSKP